MKNIDQSCNQLGLELRQRGDKSLLENFFGYTNVLDALTYVHNLDDAVVNWQPCILEYENKAKDNCRRTGRLVYEAKMDSLQHDGKQVTAVVLVGGDCIDTRDMDVVFAVGAWTVEVLARSGIKLPPEDRILIPTGIFAFQLKLDDD